MSAEMQPGEAEPFTIRWDDGMGCYRVSIPNLQEARVVSLADPASALRAVLQHPEAREALRGMLTSEPQVVDEFLATWFALGEAAPRLGSVVTALERAVDALASGVEGERRDKERAIIEIGCSYDRFSSRICERGTKGCVTVHGVGGSRMAESSVEAVARALHAAMCDRPWESGSDAHRDSYLHHARIALYGLGWSGVEGDDGTEGEQP